MAAAEVTEVVAEIVAETAETVVAAVQQTPSQLKMVKAEGGVAHVIRMGLQIGPAGSTGNGGSRVTFVWNPSLVHGRIILLPDPTATNEILTSSM